VWACCWKIEPAGKVVRIAVSYADTLFNIFFNRIVLKMKLTHCQTRTHTRTDFQHVSYGPQPIFGLVVACADWVQPIWNMRGLPGPGGGYGTRPK